MRRGLLVIAAIALIGVAVIGLAIRPASVGGYREIDPYNIAIQVTGASPAWRGVTAQTETASDVRVGVSEISIRVGTGFGDERISYVVVTLREPLAGRQVFDASTGAAIPRIAT